MITEDIRSFLNEKVEFYNQQSFIDDDPIKVVHQFTRKEDIEIIGFLVATIAWGNRKSIIKNSQKLCEIMEFQPFNFIMDYEEKELDFVHRTFNSDDLNFFFLSLKNIYQKHGGLEAVFRKELETKERIIQFRSVFLEVPHLKRSEKHLSNPEKGSAAKRINMYLRWMIRQDKKGVDFGIWKGHKSSSLFIPLDVHTGVSARKLGLIKRKQNDWKALEELMKQVSDLDPSDPCKYDFALFGLSANKELD
ncbi:MAG: hypothetical protein ACI857_002049 [Arenicella sp.]|jgi:uncharacterized protein (TIGR02757 family)